MTQEQLRKIRNAGYKYWDNEVYDDCSDWSKREVAQFSFEAGAKYALANKYDELKKQSHDIVQFLKDNDAYERFLGNLAAKRSKDEIMLFFRDEFGTSYCINSAFTWAGTQEGHRFWSEINDKWVNLSK